MPAPPSGVGDVDDPLLSSVFLLPPLFCCLAKLENVNDRVGIRYTRHWSQHMNSSSDCCNIVVPDCLWRP